MLTLVSELYNLGLHSDLKVILKYYSILLVRSRMSSYIRNIRREIGDVNSGALNQPQGSDTASFRSCLSPYCQHARHLF